MATTPKWLHCTIFNTLGLLNVLSGAFLFLHWILKAIYCAFIYTFDLENLDFLSLHSEPCLFPDYFPIDTMEYII